MTGYTKAVLKRSLVPSKMEPVFANEPGCIEMIRGSSTSTSIVYIYASMRKRKQNRVVKHDLALLRHCQI